MHLQRKDVIYVLIIAIQSVAIIVLLALHLGMHEIGETSPLEEYVKQPGFPLRYDKSLHEYQIIRTEMDVTGKVITARMPIAYCPWTGKRLPKTLRPGADWRDGVEADKWEYKLRNVSNIDEAKRLLGKPDRIDGPFDDVLLQISYFKISKKLDIVIQESKTGAISVLYVPKTK